VSAPAGARTARPGPAVGCRGARRLAPAALALSAAALTPGAAAAQRATRALVPEARLEAVGSAPLVLAAAGLFTDAGLYGRVGVTAGVGVPADTRRGAGGEAALVGRFLVDPLRQGRRGVYAGGGLGARVSGGATRALVLGVVGVEGRARRGTAAAVEVGVGGGVRLAAVLRRARADRR
jgi:hypothetical protein